MFYLIFYLIRLRGSCKRVIITASLHLLAVAYFVDIVVNYYGNGGRRKGLTLFPVPYPVPVLVTPQTRTSCSSPSSLQLTSALRITALSLVKPMEEVEEAEATLTPNDMYF